MYTGYNSGSDIGWLDLLFYAGFALFMFGGSLVGWWRWKQSRTTEPLLLSMYGRGRMLSPIAHGEIDGLPYALLVGAESPIMMIDLSYKSTAHIAALGHVDSDIEAAVRGAFYFNKSVERAELEGDFPEYFRLYVDPAHQTELRQLLDPATMAFLVDFSEENDWEIVDKQLLMVNRGRARSEANDTPMTGDAHEFAQRILPALKRMAE